MSKNHTGEWIKLGRDLWTHPKVRRIADILGGQWQMELPLSGADKGGQMRTTILVHAVVSGLSRMFLTVNRHASEAGDGTNDAVLTDMTTDNYLDEVSGLPGMQAAMIAVGWASHDRANGVLTLSNYLEHNELAKGEKRRGARGDSESADAKRKRKERADKKAGQTPDKSPGQAPLSVPDKTGQEADKSTEKRTEDSKTHIEKNSDVLDDCRISAPLVEPSAPPAAGGAPALQPAEVANGSRTEWQRKVDDLRPDSWAIGATWNADDMAVYARCEGALSRLPPRQWLLLAWYFRWCSDEWNVKHHGDKTKVTGKRSHFMANLDSYIARADTTWKSDGKPTLEAKAVTVEKKAPAPEDAPMPPGSFRAAVAGVNRLSSGTAGAGTER